MRHAQDIQELAEHNVGLADNAGLAEHNAGHAQDIQQIMAVSVCNDAVHSLAHFINGRRPDKTRVQACVCSWRSCVFRGFLAQHNVANAL